MKKYYIQLKDETLEEAIGAHDGGGFASKDEAIEEGKKNVGRKVLFNVIEVTSVKVYSGKGK